MQPLTPGAQIDELRAALRVSEQRRQQAEARLADRERALGTASAIIAALDQQIGDLRAELGTLREAAEVLHDDDQLALISECGLRNEIWA
jgi:chromosome segregation ATPase